MSPITLLAVVLLSTVALSLSHTPEDVGYELMFQDATTEVDWKCWDAPKLPSWINGSFVLPAVAQFSYGGLKFKGTLDGFGKLHRFQLTGDGQVCLRAKMMLTGFYNLSMATGTVAPGMLFDETAPARKPCPNDKPWNKYPSCNVKAPNDNTFVNTIKLGETYSTWTDSTFLDKIDPWTLDILGKWNWTDHEKIGHLGHMDSLSSAHPVRRDRGKGDLVALAIDTPMAPPQLPLGGFVNVVTISDADPTARKLLHTSPRQESTPYFHSYGVTANNVVLAYTPMEYNMWDAIIGKPMCQAFQSSKELKTNFHVIPFNNPKNFVNFDVPTAFTSNHLVNAYENETGIVYDAVTFQDAELWLVGGGAQIDFQLNKTARDDPAMATQRQQIYRYHLHMEGPQKGQVTMEPVSVKNRITDFPKLNMGFSTVKYCIYYAIESFHNDMDYASQAILKHNVCTGERQYWYKPSHFPSEAFFVPRVDDPDLQEGEDDGVVVFTATDGVQDKSYLLVLDAGNFTNTLVEQELPERMTFTTHGEWFDGMVGKERPAN